MNSNDAAYQWTWDAIAHPTVSHVFFTARTGFQWYDDLENAPTDPVVGKVLCVVAGVAIARAVLEKSFADHVALATSYELLDLADAWIDDPTDARFGRITDFLFGDETVWPNSDPRNVVWAALRVATSSVGNYEAGWALGIVVGDANNATIDAKEIARRAVESRSR